MCFAVFPNYLITVKTRTCVFVTPAPLAETITLVVPATALAAAASVSILPPLPFAATRAGLKVAVTPLGSSLTESEIVEVNPLSNAPEMFTGVLAPIFTVTELALEARMTFGAGTVRLRARVFVAPPPVAVTVTAAAPAVAPVVAVRVKVLLPLPGDAILVGENAAVTPFGNPLTDSATALLKFCAAVVTVKLVRLPAARFALAVFEVSAIAGAGAVTVKLMATVFVTPPPVPVTVNTVVPAAVPEAAVSVIVLLPFPGDAMLAGENTAVTPFGNPVIVSATAAPKPLCPAVARVRLAADPAFTVLDVALGVSVKLAVTIVSAIVAVCETPPLLPVIVIVDAAAAAPVVAEIVAVTAEVAVNVVEEKATVTPEGAPL